MAATVKRARKSASSRTDKSVGKRRHKSRYIAAALAALKKRFPHKTAAEIALRVGDGTANDVRNAERWLAGTAPSAGELVELLQSDIGEDVLVALMGDKQPQWWRRNRRTASLASARAAIESGRRQLEQLELEAGR